MAKKKSPGRPRVLGDDEDRVTVINLKDGLAYKAWLDGLSKSTLIPVAKIVRDALAKWAADRGLPKPPSGPGSG